MFIHWFSPALYGFDGFKADSGSTSIQPNLDSRLRISAIISQMDHIDCGDISHCSKFQTHRRMKK